MVFPNFTSNFQLGRILISPRSALLFQWHFRILRLTFSLVASSFRRDPLDPRPPNRTNFGMFSFSNSLTPTMVVQVFAGGCQVVAADSDCWTSEPSQDALGGTWLAS